MFKKENYLLAILALTLGSFNTSILAQDEGADDVEEVITTGTRIKSDGFEAVSPVAVVSAADIKKTGLVRMEDVLNQMPQIETADTSFEPSGETGTASLDLRGLGASRTLTLVNGRRMQPGSIWSENADIGQIPVALLERVDVLTGGASAVYGSDAVAGVVNFITRKVNGFEVSVSKGGYRHDNDGSNLVVPLLDAKSFEYPTGTADDGDTDNFSIVMGSDFQDGKGNVTMYLQRSENDTVFNIDRDYAACGLNVAGTSCGGSANTVVPHFDIYPILEASDGTTFTSYDQNFWSELTSDGSLVNDTGTRYNYAAVAQLMNPSKRQSSGAIGEFEIEGVGTAYAEINYSSFNTSGGIAQSGTFFNDEYQLLFDNASMPKAWKDSADNAFINGANYADGGLTKGEEYCSDPSDAETCGVWVGYATFVGKRNVEGGPRQDHIAVDAGRMVMGLKGDVGYKDWEYDVSMLYGKTNSSSFYLNDFSAPKLVDAIEGGTAITDYNVFTYQGVTSAMAAGVGITGSMKGQNEIESFNATVTGTTELTVPGAPAPVSFAAGFSSTDRTYSRTPDSAYEEGLLLGFGGAVKAVSGTISVDEFYGEAVIPVLDNLTADVAFRSSDYNLSGKSDTARLSLSYQLNDMAKFRVGFNTAERAPTIADYFIPESQSLWIGDDKCAINAANPVPEYTQAQCANTGMTAAQYGKVTKSPAGQYYNRGGGNLNLIPEEAETTTLGVVLDLPAGITASVDYWAISMEKAIGSVDEETILEVCALQGILCDTINRSPSGSLWLTGGSVENKSQNIGEKEWEGIDIVAKGDFDVLNGSLSVTSTVTYLMTKETTLLPGVEATITDCVGVISNKCYPSPEIRTNTKVGYTTGDDWTVQGTLRTMSGIDNDYAQDTVAQSELEDMYYLIDVNATYDINENMGVSLSINNLLDETPPILGDVLSTGYGNTIGGFYDSLGMYWNLRLDMTY
ncbi:TonB-dependent receptor [Gammaproteobacteria bacterium]|nr:TonB-dependent receptor [Gammaproteobacteria bacterium]